MVGLVSDEGSDRTKTGVLIILIIIKKNKEGKI